MDLWLICSLDALASSLNCSARFLRYILYANGGPDSHYYSFSIPKKSGGIRVISAPDDRLKWLQKQINLLFLEQLQCSEHASKVAHGFVKNKSIITNASRHVRKKIVIKIDIADYFDSIHFGRVKGFFEKNKDFLLQENIAQALANLVCFKGRLPQGAPTSPIISNLISAAMDLHLVKLAKKYHFDYTRYADDMTFSTNDIKTVSKTDLFLEELRYEVEKAGFLINPQKTRIIYNDSQQKVTGLIVNKKINIDRVFYKETRAMACNVYQGKEILINGKPGTLNQLEGRFSFIYHIINSASNTDGNSKKWFKLNTKEKDYRCFLLYKFFYNNSKPLIIPEGKTDIVYIKTALKALIKDYPDLVQCENGKYIYSISFLNRSDTLGDILGFIEGADAMINIYNYYYEFAAFCKKKKYDIKSRNPAMLLFDNEKQSEKPLKKFLEKKQTIKEKLKTQDYALLKPNTGLYVLCCPLVDGKRESEIEDLFEESVLNTLINGREFDRTGKKDKDKYYNKTIFAEYVRKNYQSINFDGFRPLLDNIQAIIAEYRA